MAAPILQSPLLVRPWGGLYRIVGVVDRLGVPGPYVVRLYDRATAKYLMQVSSDASGAYALNSIAYSAKGYFVVAHDSNASPVNAAIADLITPEPMS